MAVEETKFIDHDLPFYLFLKLSRSHPFLDLKVLLTIYLALNVETPLKDFLAVVSFEANVMNLKQGKRQIMFLLAFKDPIFHSLYFSKNEKIVKYLSKNKDIFP